MDRIDRRSHTLWNLLRANVRGGCYARVPQDTLYIFDRPFSLRQGCDRAPDHLEGQLGNPAVILKETATAYKVDTEAIALKAKQEFAAKEKATKVPDSAAKTAKKAA